MSSRNAWAGLAATVACISLWISSGMLAISGLLFPVFIILTSGVSYFSPRWAVGVLLFTMPYTGISYPGTDQNTYFYLFFSSIMLGLSVRHLKYLANNPREFTGKQTDPVTYSLLAWLITGFMSLSSLPWDEGIVRWGQLEPSKVLGFLRLKETWVLYPVLKWTIHLQSFYLFTLIRFFPGIWRADTITWMRAILVSVLITAVLGLLDYYGIFCLEFLRDIATGAGPDGRPLRLQSTFGHPAWCAMFIAAAIPSVLSFLCIDMNRFAKTSLVVSTLVLGEYVLLLTFSRGSWVTYPFTLLTIWFSIYALGTEVKRQAFWRNARRSVKKIFISFPLTLAISLALVHWIGGEAPNRYVQRFKDISKATDRTVFIKPSLELLAEHPILGGGQDSFTYRYAQEFVLPTGRYAGQKNPLGNAFNNAHNIYLQILQGSGVLGLLAFLVGLSAIIVSILRVIRNAFYIKLSRYLLSREQQLQIVFGLCVVLTYITYGVFDDVFYTPALTVFFFATMGIAFKGVPPVHSISRQSRRMLWYLMSIFFVGHVVWEYGYPGETRRVLWPGVEVGCYPADSAAAEAPQGSWCANSFNTNTRISDIQGASYLMLSVMPISTSQGLVHFRVYEGGQLLGEFAAPTGVSSWLNVKHSYSKDPVELRVETDAIGIVPALDPDRQSLDRRRFAVYLSMAENPWMSISTRTVCSPVLGQEIWRCGQGASIPEIKKIKEIKFADTLVSGENPLWVWIGKEGGEIQIKKIERDRWYSLMELGIDGTLGMPVVYVSRVGRWGGVGNGEWGAFILR